MPQKRNPHLSQDVMAYAAQIRTMVPLAMESVMTEHEANRQTSLMMRYAEREVCTLMGDTLERVRLLAEGLVLKPERMRANLDLTDGLIMAEPMMLALGEYVGRQEAHDIVYDAAQEGRCRRQNLHRTAVRRQTGDRAFIDGTDRKTIGPNRLYRPMRQDGGGTS